MNAKRMIEGTKTLDNPGGIVTTKAGALRFAKSIMKADLKRAGFEPYIVDGARGWVINYGKAVHKNPTRRKPRTAAQKAATARMLAGLKAKRSGIGTKRKPKGMKHIGAPLSAAAVRAAHRNPRESARIKSLRKSGEWGMNKTGKAYCVTENGKTIARFYDRSHAEEYAHALHRQNPSVEHAVEHK